MEPRSEQSRPEIVWNEELRQQAEEVCAIARECSRRGWLPATAGNLSFRDTSATNGRIFITPSGIDKGRLTPSDFLEIDSECRILAGAASAKPSAETGLHGVLYRDRREALAVFHVHTVANTLLSESHPGHDPDRRALSLEGYELLKALSGVQTHEHCERVPILANSQDYPQLSARLTEMLAIYPQAHGVLLERHGLYVWGESIAATWRHLEALEFLFEVESRRIPPES